MQVREVMSTEVEWIAPEDSLAAAAEKMRDHDIGSLPVAENDRLVGMLTDRDIVVRCVADGGDPGRMQVRDAMTEQVFYCRDDQSVEEVASGMGTAQVRRMPVVNADKQLVGILSLGDVAHTAEPAATGEALKDISTPSH